MKPDIVLDTHILAEVIVQYFEREISKEHNFFIESDKLNKDLCRELNLIIQNYWYSDVKNIVVTSSFSFVEIVRQFDEVFNRKIDQAKFKAFLFDTPEWMLVESINEYVNSLFIRVPAQVVMPNGEVKPIEWPDAVHVATYLSRAAANLATNDSRIRAIPDINLI